MDDNNGLLRIKQQKETANINTKSNKLSTKRVYNLKLSISKKNRNFIYPLSEGFSSLTFAVTKSNSSPYVPWYKLKHLLLGPLPLPMSVYRCLVMDLCAL